jgi:hypothetical protein
MTYAPRIHTLDLASLSDRLDALQSRADSLARNREIIGPLQVEPVLGRLLECLAEQEGQLRRHRTCFFDDVRNAHRGNADRARELGLRDQEFVKNLLQVLAWVDGNGRGCERRRHDDPLVIIADFHIEGVASAEAEAQTPLIVDPNRMLAGAVAGQGFKPIRLRPPQILKSRRRVQLIEPHKAAPENIGRQSARFASDKQFLGFGIGKRPDHHRKHKRIVYACQSARQARMAS